MSRFRPQIESLEAREVPSASIVTSAFDQGVLSIVGTPKGDQILVAADTNGVITINGQPTGANLGNTGTIIVDSGKGPDSITFDTSLNTIINGLLARSPDTQVYAGPGDDKITVNNGGIVGGLAGVSNGNVIGPTVGNNYTEGGPGNDLWIEGFGEDVFLGQGGDDTSVWRPGTISTRYVGGPGYDTQVVFGNNGVGDAFSLTNLNGHLFFQRENLIRFEIVMDGVEQVELDPGMGGGDTVFVGDLAGTGVKKVNVYLDDPTDSATVAQQRRGIDVNALFGRFSIAL